MSGRPTKASDPRVLDMLNRGESLQSVADVIGVAVSTVQRWVDKGRLEGTEPYWTLYHAWATESGQEEGLSYARNHGPRLTHELIAEIVTYVRRGHHVSTTARLVGLQPDTLYSWLQRGQKEVEDPTNRKTYQDMPPYWPLFVEVEASRGVPVDRSLIAWQAAIEEGDWRAASSFLETRYPKDWSKQQVTRIEIDVEMRQMIQAAAGRTGLDPEQLESKVVELVELATSQEDERLALEGAENA